MGFPRTPAIASCNETPKRCKLQRFAGTVRRMLGHAL
jgi:hypothetical protein